MADNNIGIDIGYGFTKTYKSDGARIFPTAVTQVVPLVTFSDLKPVTVNNEKFLVGDSALREGKGLIDTRTTTFVRSNAWLAVLGHALSLNSYNPELNKAGVIVLGIPPGEYSKTASEEISRSIRESAILYDNQRYTFISTNIKVIPQGAGIFFSYIMDNHDDFRKNVAVIDIGHYTIDMLFFSGGKYIEGTTRSSQIGISLILDDVCRAFYRKYRLSIQHKEAYRLVTQGTITILEEPYTIDDISDIVLPYASQIISIIDGFFENLPNKPEMGIIGGGGVTSLRGFVKLKYKLHIVNDPIMANAMGYWYYARGIVD
jgi:hypothetical protein